MNEYQAAAEVRERRWVIAELAARHAGANFVTAAYSVDVVARQIDILILFAQAQDATRFHGR